MPVSDTSSKGRILRKIVYYWYSCVLPQKKFLILFLVILHKKYLYTIKLFLLIKKTAFTQRNSASSFFSFFSRHTLYIYIMVCLIKFLFYIIFFFFNVPYLSLFVRIIRMYIYFFFTFKTLKKVFFNWFSNADINFFFILIF